MKISEIITDKYKLRIPPTVYYELLADVREVEEDQEPTTKNDLGVDCISRAALIERINNAEEQFKYDNMETIGSDDGDPFVDGVLSGVWNIREMVKQAPSVTPQEPQIFKWCDTCKEYDQEKHCCHRWSKVIRDTVEEMKQEYIEREVLDGIYADIQRLRGCSCSCSDGIIDDVEDILDKYKAENNS